MVSFFQRNPGATEELLSTPEALTAIGEIAAIAGQGVQNAMPVKTGYNRRSIASTARVNEGVATGYVTTSSPVWHILEYGSVDVSPQRPFARGVRAAGLAYEAL